MYCIMEGRVSVVIENSDFGLVWVQSKEPHLFFALKYLSH